MKAISAQVSVYGLGATDIAAAVEAFLQALQQYELHYEVGAMSTVIWGEEHAVWRALQEAYAAAGAIGPAVMQVTISNACPLPSKGQGSG